MMAGTGKYFLPLILAGLCLSAGALEIQSVKFGTGDRWNDLTEKFNREIPGNDSFRYGFLDAIRFGNSDPAPGTAKSLVIRYREADGAEKQLKLAGDRHHIALADGMRPSQEFILTGAWFGAGSHYIDATQTVEKLLADGKPVKLNYRLFPADPAPGKGKELILFFGLDGEAHTMTVRENEMFIPARIDGRPVKLPELETIRSPFRDVPLDTAVWQYSCPIPDSESRAFLWLPETCTKVKALMVGQFNMLEQPIMEQKALRDELAGAGIGCVWISPALFQMDHRNPEHGKRMQSAFDELARVSGHPEIAGIPFVGIGHSAMAGFPYQLALWNPERALACVSISGGFPVPEDAESGRHPLEGIPCLARLGEYENAGNNLNREKDGRLVHTSGNGWKWGGPIRTRCPKVPVSFLGDPGGSHFGYHDALCRYIGKFIVKAAQYRFRPDGSMKKIDPMDGYEYEMWDRNDPPKELPAPAREFKGKENFWTFDREMADETLAFQERYRGKKVQLLAYETEKGVIAQNPRLHSQVRINWIPREDGLTMKLKPVFNGKVEAGRPQWWLKENGVDRAVGDAAPHSDDPEKIRIRPICGPVVVLGPETAAIRFNRIGFDSPRRRNELWVFAEHPGNAEYRRVVQQADCVIPYPITDGVWQRITFPELPDVEAGTETRKLEATSSVGLPVEYYVEYGPAYLVGDVLHFTPAPGGRYPIEVSVVAWQYGIAGKVRTAVPVKRTFRIVKHLP